MPYRDHTKKSDSVKHWTGLFFDIESFFVAAKKNGFACGCRCGGFVADVLLRRFRAAGSWAPIVERGGLLAGAAHPRRQKHREMPPPGASAPAFAATVVPLLNRCRARPPHAKHPRQDASSTRYGTRAGGWAAFVHRFLISGPNLRIDASFSLFTPSSVHRFLISGPNLRIDAA